MPRPCAVFGARSCCTFRNNCRSPRHDGCTTWRASWPRRHLDGIAPIAHGQVIIHKPRPVPPLLRGRRGDRGAAVDVRRVGVEHQQRPRPPRLRGPLRLDFDLVVAAHGEGQAHREVGLRRRRERRLRGAGGRDGRDDAAVLADRRRVRRVALDPLGPLAGFGGGGPRTPPAPRRSARPQPGPRACWRGSAPGRARPEARRPSAPPGTAHPPPRRSSLGPAA